MLESIKKEANLALNMLKDYHVLIVQGGPSEEHEISLATAKCVYQALANQQVKAQLYTIDPVHPWQLINFLEKQPKNLVVFNALHGKFGEDGTLQAILDSFKIKYTHSKVGASSLGINKHLSKYVAKANNIATSKSVLVNLKHLNYNLLKQEYKAGDNFAINRILKELTYPLVAKPNTGGSSVDTFIIKDAQSLINVLQDCSVRHEYFLLEEYLAGSEFSVAVVNGIPIEVTEIFTPRKFYDYKAKYLPNGSEHILPAEINQELREYMLSSSQKLYLAMGCCGAARVDFKEHSGEVYFLEINTHPGLTNTSLLPEQCAMKGISLGEFCLFLLYQAIVC